MQWNAQGPPRHLAKKTCALLEKSDQISERKFRVNISREKASVTRFGAVLMLDFGGVH